MVAFSQKARIAAFLQESHNNQSAKAPQWELLYQIYGKRLVLHVCFNSIQ